MATFSPYSWWNPFSYTASGLNLDNFGFYDPVQGDPLGFGQTGLAQCVNPDGTPCSFSWPPETEDGGIDWWGLLGDAWDFYTEVIRRDDSEEARARQVQLAQSGAVTSGWFMLLVVGAVVGLVLFTSRGS